MRIGTWNLAGRWDDRHHSLLAEQDCNVWLLTEVSDRLELPGFNDVRTAEHMATRRRWAGVFTREPLNPLPDPHPATAAAVGGGTTFWSSILPWRSAGARSIWPGTRHADWSAHTMAELTGARPSTPHVWGGDWNHALSGREHAGSVAGRETILGVVSDFDLQVPTGPLEHRLPGLLSIDHIAVPTSWRVKSAQRVVAEADGARLSDHDLYVVEVGD